MTTEREERQLRHIGRRVAEALEPSAGRAIPAARRRLFEGGDGERSTSGRWLMAAAAVGAAAAIAFALRGDAGPDPSEGDGRTAARGADATTAPRGNAHAPLQVSSGTTWRTTTRPDGATELLLESGEAHGAMGAVLAGAPSPAGDPGRAGDPLAAGQHPRAIVAGPYRVTGDAALRVTWSDVEGLTVQVAEGEARVIEPGKTPVVVPAGTTRKLPAAR